MIKSKKDYIFYLGKDRQALKVRMDFKSRIKRIILPNYIFRFQTLLRKTEYLKNCKKDYVGKLLYIFYLRRFRKLSLRLGFSIPLNTIGPGLAILHYGTIIVNANARIGKNCKLHACTNIGASGGSSRAPQIGNNVYIAPGVKIYGDIKIADNIAIAANSSVNKSFDKEHFMIAGSPAKEIKKIDIYSLIPTAEN